jgi:hypothetical protein
MVWRGLQDTYRTSFVWEGQAGGRAGSAMDMKGAR